MGHGNNTTGTEGKASVGGDGEKGAKRLARFGSGFASGVSAVNQQQPTGNGSSINAATQVANTMLQRAAQDNEEAAPQVRGGKMPAWYIIQRQREEEAKLRAQMEADRIKSVPAL